MLLAGEVRGERLLQGREARDGAVPVERRVEVGRVDAGEASVLGRRDVGVPDVELDQVFAAPGSCFDAWRQIGEDAGANRQGRSRKGRRVTHAPVSIAEPWPGLFRASFRAVCSAPQCTSEKLRPARRARGPPIGQGTWNMERDDRASAVAALRRGLDLGLTHVDTAELYGSGQVEELVREAIAGRRDEVFLVSKVMPSHASYDGTLRACEKSLRRLGTDRLDAYLLHWPGSHPLADTIRAFEALERSGKIRAWGVSNFDVSDLEEALAIAGPGRVACNQVLYHLNERSVEARVLPFCAKHGVALVAYSPFGAGRFPSEQVGRRQGALAEVARARGATPHQVALAFLLRDPHVLVIPKAARVAHVEDVAGAVGPHAHGNGGGAGRWRRRLPAQGPQARSPTL